MSLVFYYAPNSTAVTAHWALEELGIPYERVDLNLAAGDTNKPGYLALNPNGKVPLVVHDGVPIFESVAILIHLGETFGVERDLFPPPGLERAEALKWLVWANVSLGGAVGRFLANTLERIPADQRNAKAGEVARAEAEKYLGILDADLAKKTYLVGETFSLVDVHLASYVGWLGMIGFSLDRWPNIQRWLRRATDRPSHARAA